IRCGDAATRDGDAGGAMPRNTLRIAARSSERKPTPCSIANPFDYNVRYKTTTTSVKGEGFSCPMADRAILRLCMRSEFERRRVYARTPDSSKSYQNATDTHIFGLSLARCIL